MYKKIKHILTIAIVIFTHNLQAQDAQFSQYYAAPLSLAPSFAGASDGLRYTLNHRLQWPVVSGLLEAYNTTAMGVDYYMPKFKSGVGIIGTATAAGDGILMKTKIGGLYNYNVHLFKSLYFRPGIEFSYNRIDFDINKYTFGDQLKKEEFAFSNGITGEVFLSDEDLSKFESGGGYFDIGASALFFSNLYWGGVTVAHIIQPNESTLGNSSDNTKIPIKTLVYGGGKIDLNQRMGRSNEESLFLSFLYRSQEKFDQFDLGAYYLRMPLLVGIWYRGLPGIKKNEGKNINHDAISLIMGIKHNRLGASLSYDITISDLNNSGGAYEIALSYLLIESDKIPRRTKRILVPCPRF